MAFRRKASRLQKILGVVALTGCALGICGSARGEEKAKFDLTKTIREGIKSADYFFTANYSKGDKNGNSTIDNNEIKGIGKNKFKTDERISFGARIKNKAGKRATFKLTDENGRILEENKFEIGENLSVKIYTYEKGELKAGKYFGVWKIEDMPYSDVVSEIEISD